MMIDGSANPGIRSDFIQNKQLILTREPQDTPTMNSSFWTVLASAILCACSESSINRNCNPGPLIEKHEGRKECVYLDAKENKILGVGYDLRNPNAKEDFRSVGADYEKFADGPTTPRNANCNCSHVPCLKDEQIDQLLDLSLKTATSNAQRFVSSFSTLCCPVQNVVVDMAFALGMDGLWPLEEFASTIEEQYWKAAADYLSITKWCMVDEKNRCEEDAAIVDKGCGCTGPYPQACDARASTCCGPKSEMTCCNGK